MLFEKKSQKTTKQDLNIAKQAYKKVLEENNK